MASQPPVRLELITPDDLWLTQRLEGDPEMMVHFGGPRTMEEIARVHQNRLDLNARGEAWMHKIMPVDSDQPIGSIGYWKEEWQDRPTHEMGWMVLPEHWGKGVATEAGLILLDIARASGDVSEMHAFPVVTNGPSNAICRKLGFENLGEYDFEFAGRPIRCNDWRLLLNRPRGSVAINLGPSTSVPGPGSPSSARSRGFPS